MMKILETILGALLGQVVEALNAWRRDNALKQLGYEESQRANAESALKAAASAQRIDDATRAKSAADLERQLSDFAVRFAVSNKAE